MPIPFVVRSVIRLALSAVLLAVAVVPTGAQRKRLTLEDLYHPEQRRDFTAAGTQVPRWLDDSHYVIEPRGGGGDQGLERVDVATGRTERWFDTGALAQAIARVPGVTQDEAKRLARPRVAAMNAGRTALFVHVGDDLYAYDVASARLTRLSRGAGAEEFPTFSPDGRAIAYVRDWNLYVADVATGEERALTTDGSAALLNGKLDWVYQEEIYGRGTYRAFWWSPDSSSLAFLQLDEKPVPEYTVVDDLPYRQTLEVYDYPKAGDPNPVVKLGIVRATGGGITWVDHSHYGLDILITQVGWTPDSAGVAYSVQNREQTWLDLAIAARASGQPRRVLRETTKAWVNELGRPTWLKDGSFLWFSERSGWKHLYHYKQDGTLVRQVTSGAWEARDLHGVDEAGGWIYFSGTERSHIGLDVYRIRLDGTSLTRLSQTPGTHAATFNPSWTYYFDRWSDHSTPPQLRLHKADGVEVRVLADGKVAALADYTFVKPELVQVTTRDGFQMEAMLIKPPDFDPSRKYPVIQFTYGGPAAQTVQNAWGGVRGLYRQLVAQQGVVVWLCDNRTASGKGAESVWPLYRNVGELELRDIEDGVAWLKKQPWVDPSRIGIDGWSYGGFMVTYALTHSKSFAMGIAGGSVTDWRDYDSIYTERYMALPHNNPDGYRKASPRFFAKDLSGKLLLVHGDIDDNVHVQNTLQFAYELQKAGKPFQLMLYPTQRHGIGDPHLEYHMRRSMLDFILQTLRPEAPEVSGTQKTAAIERPEKSGQR
jgi:dipeptidyl-peptidase 4